MTGAALAAREGPASNATARYEGLRRRALGTPQGDEPELGLAILVHRGVAAWLELGNSVEHIPRVDDGVARGEGGGLARGALVACVAEMVLARRRHTA